MIVYGSNFRWLEPSEQPEAGPRPERPPVLPGRKHGSMSAYNGGCRCRECTQAKCEADRKRRPGKKGGK